jgi:MoaA/NifB/PqqE/SkfB family radical SAM enzyme
MATHVGRNFCIAPFTQITYSPMNTASPCPYLGGTTWTDHEQQGIKHIWNSSEFEGLRDSFKANEKNPICNRCWREEDSGKQSSRKMLLIGSRGKLKENLVDVVNGGYRGGPRQINLRVSNLCNLRCRTCDSKSSTLFAIEGRHYEIKNNLPPTRYSEYPDTITFNDAQIDSIFEISGHLQRIEFYGGEPLLDKPTLKLLRKLIESGRSRYITLYYNTNGTNMPTGEHLELWRHFAGLEFNISIDGIGEHFTYIRHPGQWSEVLATVEYLKNTDFGVPAMVFTICSVSILNIYYLPEIIAEFQRLELDYFLNMVTGPSYYFAKNLPAPVKEVIQQRLSTVNTNSQIASAIKILGFEQDQQHWAQFKFWTREKDEYRKEKFSTVFPEFYNLIKTYDADI